MGFDGPHASRDAVARHSSAPSTPLRLWAGAFLLLLGLTVGAYGPCLTGGPVWDDDAHLTRPDLRSLEGLGRIWTDVSATQQYYPLLHSAFWVEHRLWGSSPIGYHLVNVVLHALSAALLAVLWSRLGARGGLLAAVLFALHPVAVESVAWMTEQKNTLSTVLYLCAALAYLAYRQSRSGRWYALATVVFCAALLTKSVTSTLPAALLVLIWWRSDRLSWRREVLPLLPWFALSTAMAGVTVWVERKVVGAEGAAWDLGFAERVLVAGRALWFYLGKLVWPSNLVFMYPRWVVDPRSIRQWLFPVAALLVFAGLWWIRRRSRGPLAVALLFAGSLFPALGFFSVYPFRYSFVADHFQYLGAMFVLAGSATGATFLADRLALGTKTRIGLASATALLLGTLTWQQAGTYRNAETLYESILAVDHDSWFAHHNLGMRSVDRGEVAAGIEHLETALRLKGDADEIRFGLALAYSLSGRDAEAVAQYEQAIRTAAPNADAESNFGDLLRRLGRSDEAISHLGRALELDPSHAGALHNLGLTLAQAGRWAEAVEQFDAAVRVRQDRGETWHHRGNALMNLSRVDEGIESFQRALQLNPASSETESRLGIALAMANRLHEAIPHLNEAVRLRPNDPGAHLDLANVLLDSGRLEEAIGRYERVLQLDPRSAPTRDRLGVALSRSARPFEALPHFEAAVQLAPDDPSFRYDLAVALSRAGRREEAVGHLKRTLELAPRHEQARALLDALQRR
ncbi:MAG TPA: tetratricopeptide repeat protein [Thermoanaerobaculia bacterium]|nr:tetratricopeptide repeat protein [Thermoanaerobaculia bacterium]